MSTADMSDPSNSPANSFSSTSDPNAAVDASNVSVLGISTTLPVVITLASLLGLFLIALIVTVIVLARRRYKKAPYKLESGSASTRHLVRGETSIFDTRSSNVSRFSVHQEKPWLMDASAVASAVSLNAHGILQDAEEDGMKHVLDVGVLPQLQALPLDDEYRV